MIYSANEFPTNNRFALDNDIKFAIEHLIAFEQNLYSNLPQNQEQLRKVEVNDYPTLLKNFDKLPELSKEIRNFLKKESDSSKESFDLLSQILIEAAEFLYCKSQTATRDIAKKICDTLDILNRISDYLSTYPSVRSYVQIKKSDYDNWTKLVNRIDPE